MSAAPTWEVEHDHDSFQREWIRFQRVYERRRAFFSQDDQQKIKTTRRLFTIARQDDPWQIYGLSTRLEYRRRVYEWSGLHFSSLHEACSIGDKKSVRRLLATGAWSDTTSPCSPLARDSSGRTPLHQAVIREHHSTIRLLLKQPDARLQLHARDNRDAPPAQYVLEKIYRLALKHWTAASSIPVRTRQLCARSKRVQKLYRLADRMLQSMEPGLLSEMQSLDFHVRGDAWDAVRTGDIERLKRIHEMYGVGDAEILDELGCTFLHDACTTVEPNLAVLHYLITELDLDRSTRDQSGSSPLHYAAARGWIEACVLLLDGEGSERPVDPDGLLLATDRRGRTPLHACVCYRNRGRWSNRSAATATARYLVKLCPQALHVVDHDGFMPLHYAVDCGDLSLVELMIARGANLYAGVRPVDPIREYGMKACWAPCGVRFQRHRDRSPHNTGHGDGNQDEEHVHAPAIPVTRPIHSTRPSKACERMLKVKAGQVEHPGHAVPMETLWFMLRRRPSKTEPDRRSVALDRLPELKTLSGPKATQAISSDVDLNGFGCRRFGAICDECRVVVGGTDSSNMVEVSNEQCVSISPLVLAIRCCRLHGATRTDTNQRLRIVESLVLAGSMIDNSAINEAFHAVQLPALLQLITTHSHLPVTTDHIVDHFFFAYGCPLEEMEPRQSMLLNMVVSSPDLFGNEIASSLFRWGYFHVVERIFESQRTPHGHLDEVVRQLHAPPQHSGGQRSKRQAPSVSFQHLNQVVGWIARWGDECSALTDLGWKCVDEVLNAPTTHSMNVRKRTDEAIEHALQCLDPKECAVLNIDFAEWIGTATHRRLSRTASALRKKVTTSASASVKLLCRMVWPIRKLSVSAGSDVELVQSLVDTIVTSEVFESLDVDPLIMCFAVACLCDRPLGTIAQVLGRIKRLDKQRVLDEQLASRRTGGLTIAQWIVCKDRADVATLLFEELAPVFEVGETLWQAFVSAAMALPVLSTDQWQSLLLPPSSSSLATATKRAWLASHVVRARQSSTLLYAAVDWLVTSWHTTKPLVDWIEESSFVHAIARWNAVEVMQRLLSHASLHQNDSAIWSALLSKRDSEDACSPIQLCELLGHHELAKLMRRLATSECAEQSSHCGGADVDLEPWPPARRRHFGLLRTVLSLPAKFDATRLRWNSKRAARCVRDGISGDWRSAVALNDLRLLEALHFHSIPLPSTESGPRSEDSVAILLDEAITYGSLDALAWLLTNKTTNGKLPKHRSRALVLKAARHTSGTHAKMTLRLLQHPGIDAGRLAGDGTDVTLLHRAACFANSDEATEILRLVLARDDSDVNVRDPFGGTPIAYALASGRLATACFLLDQYPQIRLEAEFEGQTAFYYTLQLLPSFGWRWIVRTLLTTRRHAAFLHCTSDDCACKGVERAATATEDTLCTFCDHPVDRHTRVPFPPWFRDQYETYVEPQDVRNVDDPSQKEEEDEEEQDDDEAVERRRLRVLLATSLVDEATLEQKRGRLRTHDLERITRLRFGPLLATHTLTLTASVLTDAAKDSIDDSDAELDCACEKLPANNPNGEKREDEPADSAANLAPPCVAGPAVDSADARPSSRDLRYQHRPTATTLAPLEDDGLPSIEVEHLPWFLRGDVAMVVPARSCGRVHTGFVHTSQSGQLDWVVRKWLRLVAARLLGLWPQSDRAPLPPAAQVFAHWRDVTMTATSTSVSFHPSEREVIPHGFVSPTKKSVPRPLPTAKEREENKVVVEEETTSSAVIRNDESTPPLVSSNSSNTSLSVLQLFLHHWRYARLYQGFRLWKRRCVNAQVALHEIEKMADTWAADARRERLRGLVERQRALEETAKAVLSQ